MFRKIKDIKIYGNEKYYSAFPAVQALPNGKIVAVFRRAPNYYGMPGIPEGFYAHGDIMSQYMSVISEDSGETWGSPNLIYSPAAGCSQDAGLFYDGKYLYANSFIWQYVPDQVAEAMKKSGQDEYLHKYLTYMLPGGSYVMRSPDLGKTWEGPFKPEPLPHNIEITTGVKLTVHNRGNIVRIAGGGPLVLAGQKLGFSPEFNSSIVLYKSHDDGKTWQYMVTAAECKGISVLEEPRLHITPSGKWVVLMRCHNLNGEKFPRARMCVAESNDNGATWTQPTVLNFHAEPATSFQMDDGRIIIAYGYRENPYGVRLRVCNSELDNLENAEEFIVRDDAEKIDTGYPWITQTDKNKFLVVYYINKLSYKGASQIEGTNFEI
ncbi:MAG: sialidase family protein [Lentisphaerota bacterium]